MQIYNMFIDGKWVGGNQRSTVVSPATEEAIGHVPIATAADVEMALQAASRAQRAWAKLTGVERGNVLRRWAVLVEENQERLATLISNEEGKPITEARGEVAFGNSWFRYFAEFDRRIEGEIVAADQPNEQIYIFRQAVGVVVAIIPWNYPMAVAVRKLAPALIAGNSVVLKPHEDTPLSALELAKLAEAAGVPPGVVNVITGPGETVGAALVRSPIPQLITFTGSVETGKAIARAAADQVTLVSLELGGKAPFIVMDDCDLDKAVSAAVTARFMNCGQVCICNERTYVHEGVSKEFVSRFVKAVNQLRVGNPLHPETQIGPKVNKAELEKTEGFVERARNSGATVVTGGRRKVGANFTKGYWYEPTVLTGVTHEMEIMKSEIFGPVVPIMEFSSFEEGLRLANDSKFGLAAYLFSNDVHRIMRTVRDLEVGELYINRGPGESIHGFHGGWKQSGIGGDDGKHGLEHYLRKKTVYLRHNG